MTAGQVLTVRRFLARASDPDLLQQFEELIEVAESEER